MKNPFEITKEEINEYKQEWQALDKETQISPSFGMQPLVQGLNSSTIQSTPSLGLSQTPNPSIATRIAKNFGLTLTLESNTLVGNLNTNPSQSTIWKPIFGAPPILEHPLHQHKPLTLYESMKTSTYQGNPSSSIPIGTTSVPNITQGGVDQVSQKDQQGQVNNLAQNQPLMQTWKYLSNQSIGSS